MKVFLDGTPFLIEKTGIGHYTENLLLALRRADPQLQLGIYTISLRRGHRLARLAPSLPDLRVKGLNLPANFLYYAWWPRFGRPSAEDLVGPLDILHAVNYQAPPLRQARLVATIHDVNFLRFPDMQSRGINRFRLTLRSLVERSAAVLTDSEFTARELEELGLAGPERLRVVYPGLHPAFSRPPDEARAEEVRRRFGLQQPYLAYVGNLHPRKNLATLVEAYALLRREGLPHRLAIIGGGGLGQLHDREYRKLLARVEEIGLQEAVVFTGYVEDEGLPDLLCGAEALVFPSLYEGFGLPPLEAMACGVPVVASRRASIPEVTGEAALYLEEPADPAEMAGKVAKLLANEKLREELVRRGRERARLFTWEEAAQRVLEVYWEVAGT